MNNAMSQRKHMRKIIPLFMLLAAILSACGALGAVIGPNSASGASSPTLPLATQLALGTLKLEGTDQAITAKQAADLLPMWQVYGSLITSDTAAQEEIDGLIQQIQETMTPQQLQAIKDMNLSAQDMFGVLRDQGGQAPNGARSNATRTGNNSNSGTRSFRQGGDLPGGFPGGPGGFGQGFATQSQSGNSSRSSRNGTPQGQTSFSRLPTPILNTLITLLEKRAAG
jgi:hypothetical protein